MSSLNLHHEGVTVEFSDETFLYHAVITYRDRTKTQNINVIPLPHDEAQHIVDSFHREMKKECGDFNLVSDVTLQRVHIPVAATVEDRRSAWWRFGEYLAPMRKHDCWFLSHYRLRVLDSECLDLEEALLIRLLHLQREHERKAAVKANATEWANVIVSALTCEDTPTEVYHHLRSEINGAFVGA